MGDCVTLANQYSWDCYFTVITPLFQNLSLFFRLLLVFFPKGKWKPWSQRIIPFSTEEMQRKRTTAQFVQSVAATAKESDKGRMKPPRAWWRMETSNNEAEDDNIFCMMSVFVKAVLTQRDGTLNHPHTLDVHTRPQTHTQTRPKQARSREDFTSHFPARCHVKYAIARGEEETWGHFVWEVYASFVSQHTPHRHTHIFTHIHSVYRQDWKDSYSDKTKDEKSTFLPSFISLFSISVFFAKIPQNYSFPEEALT